jgi:hypothetical protein
MPSEAVMRIGSVLLLIWLVIGGIAGGQRHYYSGSDLDCAQTGTIIVTVLAGPLNYSGLNPEDPAKHCSRASALRCPPLRTAA